MLSLGRMDGMHGQNETKKLFIPNAQFLIYMMNTLAISAVVELNTNKHVG